MKILISGASGLLGTHAVKAMGDQHEIHAIVRTNSSLAGAAQCHTIDLSAEWSTRDLPQSIDAVMHLAQSAHFRDFPERASEVFRVNVDSSARLLDYARIAGAKKFILASSGGVYGAGPQAFHENSPIDDHGRLGFYLGTKLCSEVLSQSYAGIFEVFVLRFFFMYGIGQRRSMLIPRLVDNVRAGRPITLQKGQGICINPVHVSDAVAMLQACTTLQGSRTINVAGPEKLSLRRIAEIIGMQVGLQPVFEIVSGEPADLIGSNELMSSILGRPLSRFEDRVVDVL